MNQSACGVLFDLDGTLVDSIADLADAMNAALAEHGQQIRSLDDCTRFVGDGARRFVQRALDDRGDPKLIDAILESFARHYQTCWAAKSRPYAGIPELLDALVARGLTLAVLSNKGEHFTVQMVEQLLKKWRFARVRGARSGFPIKPDPAGALAIARELAIPPERWLYLGDTSTDMETANGAGMLAVGVTWGFRPAAELSAGGAAHLIAHPLELLPLVDATGV